MADPVIPQVWTRTLPTVAPNQQYSLGLSTAGGLHVSNVEPRYLTLSTNGYVYAISAGVVANAKIPVTDVGTTTAAWALYNGNTAGGAGAALSYTILPLFIGYWLASGTSDIGASMIVGVSPTAQASAVTNATGIVGPKSMSASASQRTSLATLGGAVTLAGAPAWVPIANGGNHAASATVGSGAVVDVEGMFAIPPGYAMGITILSGTGTTAKYAVSVIYAEVPAYLS